jgi:hypothetical protein|tara:strand:+ start:10 stop:480 length:471 start_codon:yes stop_codon:yes gene_type:complete
VLKTQESRIRTAEEDDSLDLLFFCKKFYKKAGYEKTGAFDKTKTLAVIQNILSSNNYYKKVVEVDGEIKGFASFTVVDNPFSNTKIGSEVFFWIEETKHSGRDLLNLLKDYEEWCKQNGCVVMKFGTVPLENVDKLETFLKKKGFVKAETAFIKEI